MEAHKGDGEGDELQFFGRMFASVSHEIKNVLAIINENAGLLLDLAAMAEKGRPLDPERLKTVLGRIGKQVQRADGIAGNMNKLAHSADAEIQHVDLNETAAMMVALAGRFAAQQEVRLEQRPAANPVVLRTRPVLLEHLMLRCLEHFMPITARGGIIELSVEPSSRGAQIKFTHGPAAEGGCETAFPSPLVKALLARLGAEIARDPEDPAAVRLLLGRVGSGP